MVKGTGFLAVALLLLAGAPARKALAQTVSPAPAPPSAYERGQKALRSGDLSEARKQFEAWLAQHPGDPGGLAALGFTALRQDRLDEAAGRFGQALDRVPGDADALYGSGLCLLRQGRPREARAQFEAALKAEPARTDLQEALAQARVLAPDPLPPLPPLVRPDQVQMPARVQGQRFEISNGKGGWRPFFIKGMNLGAALPGKHPSEFPDKATYTGWIAEMAELGVNAIRVYTVHPPGFYEALAEHNARAAKPLWLIHGVWTEPPPGDDFLDEGWWADWRAEMRKVVDLLHGRSDVPSRPGHASGAYRADVSRWTLAIILGREWEPYSVVTYNQKRPGLSDYTGQFLSIRQGHATEVFMAMAMDFFLKYEHDTYRAQRPIAYTNWPSLDPLVHPTEATKDEELAWQRKYGLTASREQIREYDNDALGLDMEKMDTLPACQAGIFASYHAYPYYPDFMNLDPGYQKGRDHVGPNHYAAYLQELVKHHSRHPVVISEFGVPSSRLVAHWQPQGLTHGGQNEREQGLQDARMFRAIHEAGCAGGILFAWIDEWFKKNWLVIEFEEPLERKPLWYNVQDAEENYGLIAYRPGAKGPVIRIDGKADDWKAIPDYLAGPDMKLKVVADEGWLHLGVFFKGPVPAWATEGFAVGIDTHDPRLGSHRLPWSLGLRSTAGLECIARLQGSESAVYVDEPYDLFTHRLARPYQSIPHDSGRFVMPRTESNRPRIGRDGTRYPGRRQEIGWLRRGTQDRTDPAFDSRAEWLEGRAEGDWHFVEASLPWGLLNVTDPSSRRVVRDTVPPSDAVGTAVTDGFRLCLVRFRTGAKGLEPTGSLPQAVKGLLPLPPLFTWPTWERPTYHRIRKQSFDLVKECLRELPD
ncbi:MAG TPA: tetratricopeptide repeat protein [Geothrix sp.]